MESNQDDYLQHYWDMNANLNAAGDYIGTLEAVEKQKNPKKKERDKNTFWTRVILTKFGIQPRDDIYPLDVDLNFNN